MRCATSSPIPTPAPCCPCSEQPPAERIFRREGFSVLSFLSGKEKKEPKKRNPNGEGFARKLSGSPPRSFVRVGGGERSFFSFGKRAKEPKKRKPIGVGDARKPSGSPPQKRNPNGEGFARKLSGSPPRSFVRVGGGERSFFSFGKRAKEPKKRKPIGVGDARKPSGSPPQKRNPNGEGFARKLSGSPPRSVRFLFFPAGLFFQKSPAKIFLRGMCVPLTGGRSGPAQAGS